MIDKVLDLYQQYTGKVLSEAQREVYTPYAMRAIHMMEQRLGWPLDGGKDAVDVLGVAKKGCICDGKLPTDLDLPPQKDGIYRLFPMNTKLPNILLDPFTKLNHVYIARIDLEHPAPTANNAAVILQTITDITPTFMQGNIGRYIKACHQMTACQQACGQDCTNCANILVDAQWMTIDDLPESLLYMLFDYMDWVADGGLASRSIRSESVDGHSVSYGSWTSTAPYYHSADAAILRSYMGPYGSVGRKYIR